MKLVRYGKPGQEKPGLIDAEGKLRDLSGVVSDIGPNTLDDKTLNKLAKLKTDKLPLVKGKPRMGACVARPLNFVCIGLNYADHAAETGATPPTEPIVFLKSLGASNWGVLQIFLAYGLLLGVIGAFLGTLMGLAITVNINEIEQFLARTTGQDIFPRDVYYFDRIPTEIQPTAIGLVNLGSVGIAALFSILPALRAAMLHPVRALRFE